MISSLDHQFKYTGLYRELGGGGISMDTDKEVGGLTRTFALFALWTHTTVHGISRICHTLHTLRTGVVLTQVVQRRTSATYVPKHIHTKKDLYQVFLKKKQICLSVCT